MEERRRYGGEKEILRRVGYMEERRRYRGEKEIWRKDGDMEYKIRYGEERRRGIAKEILRRGREVDKKIAIMNKCYNVWPKMMN